MIITDRYERITGELAMLSPLSLMINRSVNA